MVEGNETGVRGVGLQQVLPDQQVVRARVVGRHEALVHKDDGDLAPVDLLPAKGLEEFLRRRAARYGQAGRAACRDTCDTPPTHVVCQDPGQPIDTTSWTERLVTSG